MKKSLKHLTPLNDSAERALALATRVNTHITRELSRAAAGGGSTPKEIRS